MKRLQGTVFGNAAFAVTAIVFLNGAGEYCTAPLPQPTVAAGGSPLAGRHPVSRRAAPGAKSVTAPRPENPKLKGRIEKSEMINADWQKLNAEAEGLYSSGKYDLAYKRWADCAKAVEVQRPWLTASGAPLIEMLKKLATMYKTQSKPNEACKMYDMAVMAAIKTYGKDSLPVAQLMLEQGKMYTFYDGINNPGKADELLGESLRINEKMYGRYSIPAGDVDMIIAQLREKQHRYGDALNVWQLVIDIGDRLEPNSISCCRIGPRQGRARCLEQLGRLDDALRAHQDLIAMCNKGARDMLPTVRSAYASCLMKAGRTDESTRVYAEANAQ